MIPDERQGTRSRGEKVRGWRLAAGLSQATVGNLAGGITQATVSLAERGLARPDTIAKIEAVFHDMASLEANEQLAAAEWAVWLDADASLAPKRAAMLRAAAYLCLQGDYTLARLLVTAQPDAIRLVSTGVAAHALRRYGTDGNDGHPWDVLAEADLLLQPQADDWFFTDGVFEWAPASADLIQESA